MLPNSDNLLCEQTQRALKPSSSLFKLDVVPFSFSRQSNRSFLGLDVLEGMTTNIMEFSFGQEGMVTAKSQEQFLGVYEYCCFGDDHAFLMNREGDIIYYDLCSKDSFFAEKQHPSPFSPLQIHYIGACFVTCGGNIKNSDNSNEPIVKVWQFQNDELTCKARVGTGHSKAVENSLVMGFSKLLSMSTDRTVRIVNLSTQKLEQVVKTNKDYYSGCQIDWNTVLLGGVGKTLDMMDIRCKRMIYSQALDFPVLQICEMGRLTDREVLFSNVNQLYSVDLRAFKATARGVYDGERVSTIKAVSQDTLIIGNRDKTLQLWRFQ